LFYKTLLPLSFTIFTFTAQATAVITLNNGDEITAEVTREDEINLYLSHPILGELVIPQTQIAQLTAKDDPKVVNDEVLETEEVAEVPVAEVEAKKPTDNGLFGLGLLENWKRRFDLGIAGSAGRNENSQINAGFTADYEDNDTRISHKSSYYRSESNGTLSNHNFYSTLNKDWLDDETPWLVFATGRLDIDEFKDWDYRVNADAGVGYEFINSDKFLLVGKTGLGFNQTFGGEDEEFTPEGSLGVETKWKLSKFQQLKFSNTYFPHLEDFSEFRNVTNFDWTLDLNTFVGVALKLGLSNEHDSTVDDGEDKNDFKYTVSLSWTL
jgi:putative salt-induced outer membrane protein YdiY